MDSTGHWSLVIDHWSLIIDHWSLIIIILLVAAFFRFYRLDSIPPGLTHDEADTGYFVAAVYRGEPSSVETPYGYSYQPLTMYSGAIFMALLGPTDLALRFHSAFLGLVLLVFTYLWAKRVFGVATGLAAAALVAISFWTVSGSRVAINVWSAPPLFTGAVYFLWRAMDGRGREKNWLSWGLFVLLFTASFYAYETALAAAVSIGLLFIYLMVVDWHHFHRYSGRFASALFLVGLFTAPHLLDPSSWGRTSMLAGPLRAAAQGKFDPLLKNAVSTLGTLSFSGDSFITYNLPGRPIFDPLVSLFFYGGIALCIKHWRKPAYAFTLMWLAAGMLPSLIVGKWASTSHSNAAVTPMMVLPALCAVETGYFVAVRFGRRWGRIFAIGCATWLIVVASLTARDYFVRWGQSSQTRAAYFHNMVAITDYLNDVESGSTVAISSPFPDLPLDPFIADMRLQRDDLSLRWFDARRAVLFPDTSRSLFIAPPNTPLAPYFVERLELQPVERVLLRPDDVDPYFDVWEWNPSASFSHFSMPSVKTVTAGGKSLRLPVNLGGAVDILAYELLSPAVRPGETVTLATVWRVLDPDALGTVPTHAYGRAAAIFVHVLDAADTVVGQEDRLDAPAWNWCAGDGFVQLHHLQIAAGTSPGSYRLEVGIYTRPELARLPVLANGLAVDDRIFLQPVEVVGQ